jgi:transposase
MGRPYSQDLRERVIAVVDGGSGVTEASRLLRLSVAYVSKVMSRRNATGETTARTLGRGPRPKLADHHEALRRRVAEMPDETLEELRAWLLAEHAVAISVSRLCTTLRDLKLTRKKRRSMPPSRSAPMSPPHEQPGARRNRR